MLHSGYYALTVAVASALDAGPVQIEDRIENALVFPVHSDEEVVGLLRFPTTFEVE
jgi:hypothetical protein